MCCLWTCVSSLTDCAASGLVCSTTACAASGRVSLLWRPVLLLNVSLLCAFPGRVRVSVLQQSVMSSEVSGLQLHACASNARICSTAANAVSRGVWPTAACAASVLSVCKSLCCTWTCLFSIFKDFCATPGVSVYKSFVLHIEVSVYKSFALHLDVSADRSFVLYLDVPVCKNFCCTCACLSTRAL